MLTPLIPLSNRYISIIYWIISCLRGGIKKRGAGAPLERPGGDNNLRRGIMKEGLTTLLDTTFSKGSSPLSIIPPLSNQKKHQL
jgi:hypothetical protein